ncbi:GNAT family N-acetyltransferase [Liquorilactobacillus satsumensis]|nr:GNAT family N-acetyltransferase [Liquorilactobacillus satsumensis]MCP9313687.1 GNAT family N-acetyltransferase [Liquorilactobacillus satsumensis]MCP9327909.1 GNAT family N-acetyltransferase [Liquorilactobacillus satsumensis]MCP9358075.1 GNAT family N-acetyltransferase [Liquorilactobacillus satsumensis]MCP9360827.1 GNAT family N-acetyltransferase [Liquorilactobacillus satsumensis]MCP9372022.1 GNAT family N-acetyltransferase [Liquorilactobacillus satsumensis]
MMHLLPMTEIEFQHYLSTAIKEYAKNKIDAGTWTNENAFKNANASFKELLPAGIKTANTFFYSITFQADTVGYIWFASYRDNPLMAFIYDFKIYDNFQNKGFGSKALQLTTQEAKLKGFSSIALHVFGSNKRAIHVYEKNGFTTTDITMQKKL